MNDSICHQDDAYSLQMAARVGDIEDAPLRPNSTWAVLHDAAARQGRTTYLDPDTGLTVFTELLHLQRGTCCGSQCRHCPYGWVHVADTSIRRPAVVTSGDVASVKTRRQYWRQQQEQYIQQQHHDDDNDNDQHSLPPSLTAASPTEAPPSTDEPADETPSPTGRNEAHPTGTASTKTGGRHGGRWTEKNVPYTRGGDQGTTQLLTGERRSKADRTFEAMGTVDELCSVVGVVYAELQRDLDATSSSFKASSMTSGHDERMEPLPEQLLEIMSRLFDIGSHIAKPRRIPRRDSDDDTADTSGAGACQVFQPDGVGGGFDPAHVQELEDWIDQLTDALPELTSFILPTGSPAAAQLHVARCVCRRAERCVVPLVVVDDENKLPVCDPHVLQYLNRLSDYLFTAARYVNYRQGRDEIQYRRAQRGDKQRQRIVVPKGNHV